VPRSWRRCSTDLNVGLYLQQRSGADGEVDTEAHFDYCVWAYGSSRTQSMLGRKRKADGDDVGMQRTGGRQ
jgi:hypothetical protein